MLLIPTGKSFAVMIPKAASPLKDKGSNGDLLDTDQLGNARLKGAGVDIGAVEFA